MTDSLLLSYNLARLQIKNGDIVFVHGARDRLVHRIIMFFTNSTYVHVGIAFWINIDSVSPPRLMIIEAQGGTSRRIINLSFYKEREFDILESIIPWNDMEDVVFEKVGTEKYGWITATYVGLREFLLKNLNIKLPKSNLPGEICSEFVARAQKLKPVEISPETLFQTLLKKGSQIKIKVRKV